MLNGSNDDFKPHWIHNELHALILSSVASRILKRGPTPPSAFQKGALDILEGGSQKIVDVEHETSVSIALIFLNKLTNSNVALYCCLIIVKIFNFAVGNVVTRNLPHRKVTMSEISLIETSKGWQLCSHRTL